MLPTALTSRQAEIVELVRARGFQSTAILAELFGVAEQTIRRDVNDLCRTGMLRRRHGGAELPGPQFNLGFAQRRVLHFPAKQQIARLVAARVPNGASLAVSIGTTPEIVLRELATHMGLRIVTNSIPAALAAIVLPGAEVTLAGGRLRAEGCDVLGEPAERMFAQHMVDIGLFGVGGVDAGGGLLDFSEEEIRARDAIARNCRRRFLVLDHSKFGRAAHVRGGTVADADLVFCDRAPPVAVQRLLAEAGRELVLPREAAA